MTISTWPQSTPIYVPAGAWIRERHLPAPTPRKDRQQTVPEWKGVWHATTGDVDLFAHGHRRARVRCGHRVAASIDRRYDGREIRDAVVADELPSVDVCVRCVTLTRPDVTVSVRPRRVTLGPAEGDPR